MLAANLGVIRQYIAGVSASLSVCIAGCWLGWASPAVKSILAGQADIHLSPDQVSWAVSLMDFGNILSPIPSGYMSDSLGRKNTLLLTAFLYLGTWALAIFGTAAWHLFVARIGAGIGKGVAFTVVPMYLGEIAGVQVRGAISTIFTGLLYSGVLFEYCIGPFVSFRWLNILSSLVPILFFLTFFLLPESPYYLLMKKQHQKAKTSLQWFRNIKTSTNEVIEKELNEMQKTVEKDMEESGRFVDVVATPGSRRALTIVAFLSAFQRFGGVSPMLAYTVVTLPHTGGYFRPDIYPIFFALIMVVGNFMSTPFIDKLGRKPLLLLSCATCALSTGVSTIFYWNSGPKNNLEGFNWIPYFCFVLYGITYAIGIGVIPSTFVGELFPTNVKSYASSIGAMSFAAASFAINKFYLFVKDNYGAHYMYGFFTLCSLITLAFTQFVVFETKGKTFAEIQDKLNKHIA